MGCSLKDFAVGQWETVNVDGHKVEMAEATTKGVRPLSGMVYKLDGKFQGFTGSRAAVLYWVKRHDDDLQKAVGNSHKAVVDVLIGNGERRTYTFHFNHSPHREEIISRLNQPMGKAVSQHGQTLIDFKVEAL